MSEASPPQAARWEDPIAHNQSQLLRLLGEIANGAGSLWAYGRILRVAIALNPAGLAFLGASILIEYLIGKGIDWAADTIGTLMEEPGIKGIEKGSDNVSINRRPAARGGENGDPLSCHRDKKIIEGSRWVSINEKPAARVNDWTNDSGKISAGSPNVFVGGPKVSADRQSELQAFAKYAFQAVDLRNAYRQSWREFGRKVTSVSGDAALDRVWDFMLR